MVADRSSGCDAVPTPDDAADALAPPSASPTRDAGRATASATRASSTRSALAPIARGESRATSARSATRWRARGTSRARRRAGRPARAGDAPGDRLGRGHRSARSRPIRSSSRSAGSAIACSRRRPSCRPPGPAAGSSCYTHHLVREDQQALYGFRTSEELGFFDLLLTVTGVGPKVALAIVGSRPVADLQLAIIAAGPGGAGRIPGIGKKLAERVIFELKEKVAAAGVAPPHRPRARAEAAEGEVVAALQALGYSLAEAREASRAGARRAGRRRLPSRIGSRRRCGRCSATDRRATAPGRSPAAWR